MYVYILYIRGGFVLAFPGDEGEGDRDSRCGGDEGRILVKHDTRYYVCKFTQMKVCMNKCGLFHDSWPLETVLVDSQRVGYRKWVG